MYANYFWSGISDPNDRLISPARDALNIVYFFIVLFAYFMFGSKPLNEIFNQSQAF